MSFDAGRLDWDAQRASWPNSAHSRFVMAEHVRFHVQVAGSGPVLLLLHGTGASTHSWRDILPLLQDHYTVVAPDLPGHAFSSMPALGRVSLEGYGRLIGGLLAEMKLSPDVIAGHSAGAAIAVQMALDGHVSPRGIVSFNGAFVPMGGAGDKFFSPLARMLSLNPLMPRLFAWRAATRSVVERLIEGTGSHLDGDGIGWYQRLMTAPEHASAALQMVARWDLHDMVERMAAKLQCPLLLVAGEHDRAIPMRDAHMIAGKVAGTSVTVMHDAGHLAHEEHPAEAVTIIKQACAQWLSDNAQAAGHRMTEGMAC